MVYAGNVGTQKVSLGVSGRLDGREMRNLIMWDEETNSLWSQLKGEAVYGKSKGKRLGMLPAIFVGLGTWQRMYPKTIVLNMSTVRRKPWYYQSTDMKRGYVEVRQRGGGSRRLPIGIGVRHGKATLVVTNEKIRKDGIVNTAVGGVPIAFVWIAKHDVPLVYDRRVDGEAATLSLDGEKGEKIVTGDLVFDALYGIRESGKGQGLARFPYIPTYVKAWQGYYPKGEVLK